MFSRRRWWQCGIAIVGCCGTTGIAEAADTPPLATVFAYKPSQKDVDCENPTVADYAKCKVDVERRGKVSGWVVFGPGGQVVRRFVDTDGDGSVDQWRYYNLGMEVFRDIDTNKNNKPDQCRWVNFAGSRWGLDANEDGRIDQWRQLSAAEASREAINAIAAGDMPALQSLMINAEDLRSLGIARETSAKLLELSGGAVKTISASKSKLLGAGTKWMRFDAQMPSLIPADDERPGEDLLVYENAMVIVENGGASGLVQLGEMVLVGDVWKLTQAPLPIEGTETIAAGGILMQPALSAGAPTGGIAPSPEMQKLLADLQKLDDAQPQPGAKREDVAKYNARRAELILGLYNQADGVEEKEMWLRQLIDGLAAAVQTGSDIEGLSQLKKLETDLRKSSPESSLVAYAEFRVLQSEYTLQIMAVQETEKRTELQKQWLESLAAFIKKHPESEDAPDAMLQLAVTEEFNNRTKEALDWYRRLASLKADSSAVRRASGAIRRLELKGKSFALSGPMLGEGTLDIAKLRGKTVLVIYWATNCVPCTEDLPELRQLYQAYKSKGFEIVGVCLDMDLPPVAEYIQTHKVPWPQIYEGKGLESPAAIQYGVISLPTMFLVNAQGIVESRNTSVQDLKLQLPGLLK